MSKFEPTAGPWGFFKGYIVQVREDGTVPLNTKIVAGVVDVPNEADKYVLAASQDLLKVCQLILAEWEKPTEGVLPGELIARLSQYSKEARAAVNKALPNKGYDRLAAFHAFSEHDWYHKLYKKLTPTQKLTCERFIQERAHLNKDAYCLAVTRWNPKDPPKNFLIMNELCLAVGTQEPKS